MRLYHLLDIFNKFLIFSVWMFLIECFSLQCWYIGNNFFLNLFKPLVYICFLVEGMEKSTPYSSLKLHHSDTHVQLCGRSSLVLKQQAMLPQVLSSSLSLEKNNILTERLYLHKNNSGNCAYVNFSSYKLPVVHHRIMSQMFHRSKLKELFAVNQTTIDVRISHTLTMMVSIFYSHLCFPSWDSEKLPLCSISMMIL